MVYEERDERRYGIGNYSRVGSRRPYIDLMKTKTQR